MPSGYPLRPLLVLTVTLLVTVASVARVPEQLAEAHPVPIGAAAGVAMLLPRWRATLAVVVVGLGIAGALIVFDHAWSESVVVASAHTWGAAAAAVVMTHNSRRRAALSSERDVGWLFAAALSGGLVSGLAVLGARALLGWPDALGAAAIMSLANFASTLVLVPLILPKRASRQRAGAIETASQFLVLAALLVAFALGFEAPLLFVVLAALAWGARRLSTTTALVQMVVTVAVVGAATFNGRGMLAVDYPYLSWVPDADALQLSLFILCCAMVVVPISLDVGLQQAALTSASAERDRAERIIDSVTSMSIIGTDPNGFITLASPGASRLMGYTPGELIGRNIEILHRPEEIRRQAREVGAQPTVRSMAAAFSRPENAGRQLEYVRADGSTRVHLTTVNTVYADDEVVGFVSISEDVTSRVEEERLLREANEGLRRLDASKDVFVSSVSHELRTPLASSIGYLELLADGAYGDLSPEQLSALERIDQNSQRLLRLIDDLLTFARLGEGSSAWSDDEVDLAEVVLSGAELSRGAADAGGLGLDVDVVPDPVRMRGDRALLERMVTNLVGNAVKFTPAGGWVRVGLQRDDGGVVLTVADTGIGIPADELPRLFERFFRSRLALERTIGGSGIGLSIVRAVVESHGGRIDVSSVEDAGTVVRIWLPVDPDSANAGNIQNSTTVEPGI